MQTNLGYKNEVYNPSGSISFWLDHFAHGAAHGDVTVKDEMPVSCYQDYMHYVNGAASIQQRALLNPVDFYTSNHSDNRRSLISLAWGM